MKRLAVIALFTVACKGSDPKPTMTPQQVIDAMTDLADRGCTCGTDKECFREVRDEWEQSRKSILFNAYFLKGAERDTYDAAKLRFRQCGDVAGLTVFDSV